MSANERVREVMELAKKLGWIWHGDNRARYHKLHEERPSYPLMQLSEVEKCMLAMVDDQELKRMRQWVREGKKE